MVSAYLLNSRKCDGVRRFNVPPIIAKILFKGEFVALCSDLQEVARSHGDDSTSYPPRTTVR